nr:PREDICTED: uncharacterized protein LOC109453492 [Rhinolophus sinicus]
MTAKAGHPSPHFIPRGDGGDGILRPADPVGKHRLLEVRSLLKVTELSARDRILGSSRPRSALWQESVGRPGKGPAARTERGREPGWSPRATRAQLRQPGGEQSLPPPRKSTFQGRGPAASPHIPSPAEAWAEEQGASDAGLGRGERRAIPLLLVTLSGSSRTKLGFPSYATAGCPPFGARTPCSGRTHQGSPRAAGGSCAWWLRRRAGITLPSA